MAQPKSTMPAPAVCEEIVPWLVVPECNTAPVFRCPEPVWMVMFGPTMATAGRLHKVKTRAPEDDVPVPPMVCVPLAVRKSYSWRRWRW